MKNRMQRSANGLLLARLGKEAIVRWLIVMSCFYIFNRKLNLIIIVRLIIESNFCLQ